MLYTWDHDQLWSISVAIFALVVLLILLQLMQCTYIMFVANRAIAPSVAQPTPHATPSPPPSVVVDLEANSVVVSRPPPNSSTMMATQSSRPAVHSSYNQSAPYVYPPPRVEAIVYEGEEEMSHSSWKAARLTAGDDGEEEFVRVPRENLLYVPSQWQIVE